MSQWLDRYPLAHEDHVHDLERVAAMHEFHGKLPRDQAELAAYHKYKVLQHQKAAAHHLNGIRSSKSNGNIADGQRHYIMYCAHLKELGLNPNQPVAPEIMAHLSSELNDSFKDHESDCFVSTK